MKMGKRGKAKTLLRDYLMSVDVYFYYRQHKKLDDLVDCLIDAAKEEMRHELKDSLMDAFKEATG